MRAAPPVDVTAIALVVVSEKTGYPVDMLDLDMEMEAGLGIDSIKQVEILSELQERLPGIPEIAPSELANLRTLRDVADKLSAGLPAGLPVGTAPEAASVVAAGGPAAESAPAVDVTAMALEVVSEKTGYPVEMLDLDMEMEAGLGIDSIKQVEILSELQERLPGLPEIAPSELANMRTLRDVADKLSAGLPAGTVPEAAPVAAAGGAGCRVSTGGRRNRDGPGGRLGEDRLPGRDAGSGYGDGGRAWDRLDQAGRDPVRACRSDSPASRRSRRPSSRSLRTLRDVADKLSAGLPAAAAAVAAPVAASIGRERGCACGRLTRHAGGRRNGAGARGRLGEDRLPGRDAGPGHGDGGRARDRLDQAGRDPVRASGAPPRYSRRSRRPSSRTLRTLRDVADKLVRRVLPATVVEEPSAAPAEVSAVSSPTEGVDVTALALEVVAEKTGYPVEMLDLDMEMEAGLGIDSIKQVEILSELQERLPGIPEIAPSELASLRTLRDVADKLSGGNATNASPEPVVTPEPIAEAPADAVVTAAPVEQVVEASAVVDPTKITAFVPTLVADARPGFGLPPLATGNTIEVTNEHASLAQALVDGLVARGVSAVVVRGTVSFRLRL